MGTNHDQVAGDGACATEAPDLMFPEEGDRRAEERAKTVCRGCPVRETCLEGALARREEWGIWGGLTRKERQAYLKRLYRKSRRAGHASTLPPPPIVLRAATEYAVQDGLFEVGA